MYRGARSGELEHQLVDIAPAPGFSGFDGPNDRVIRRVRVLGRMFVLRAVATPDMTASEAQAQMDPVISCLEALFATGAARSDWANVVQMGALHDIGPSQSQVQLTLGPEFLR